MIVQNNFLERIKQDFRLNIYEVKIWTALLSRGIASAGELADISGVPRSRCYDVLESLEKKGFIVMKIGKPIKYIAVKPQEIIDRVKQHVEDKASVQLKILDSVRGTGIFEELKLLHKTGIEHVDPTDLTNSIIGRDNLNHFLKSMVANAKKSVVISTTDQGFARKVNLLKNVISALNKKGVKTKIYGPIDKKLSKKVQGNADLKDVKTNLRFVNVDNKELLFFLSGDDAKPDYDAGIWIKSEFFTKSLQSLFEGSFK